MLEIELFICIKMDLGLMTYNSWYAIKPNQSKPKPNHCFFNKPSLLISKCNFFPGFFLFFLKRAPKPTDDPLYGMRVHSWILVEAGKREVPESFFIEPFTGLPQPLLNEQYLGIESVWNHQNYWANMQDCSKGVMVSNFPFLFWYKFPLQWFHTYLPF